MADDQMGYHDMVDRAMRGVVREALLSVVKDGLPSQHHFYVTFRTTDPGVDISERLRAQFPEEMTIVIQHRFWDLEVDDDFFEVTLSFGGDTDRLHIPFAAMLGFVDPAVTFGLQFGAGPKAARPGAAPVAVPDAENAPVAVPDAENAPTAEPPPGEPPDPKSGDVVTLDSFRKK